MSHTVPPPHAGLNPCLGGSRGQEQRPHRFWPRWEVGQWELPLTHVFGCPSAEEGVVGGEEGWAPQKPTVPRAPRSPCRCHRMKETALNTFLIPLP